MSPEQVREFLLQSGVSEANIEQLERAGLTNLAHVLELLIEANPGHLQKIVHVAQEINARLVGRRVRAS